jgi:hypothetical protein
MCIPVFFSSSFFPSDRYLLPPAKNMSNSFWVLATGGKCFRNRNGATVLGDQTVRSEASQIIVPAYLPTYPYLIKSRNRKRGRTVLELEPVLVAPPSTALGVLSWGFLGAD